MEWLPPLEMQRVNFFCTSRLWSLRWNGVGPKFILICYHSVDRCDRSVVIFNYVGCVVRLLGDWGVFFLHIFGDGLSSYYRPYCVYLSLQYN